MYEIVNREERGASLAEHAAPTMDGAVWRAGSAMGWRLGSCVRAGEGRGRAEHGPHTIGE